MKKPKPDWMPVHNIVVRRVNDANGGHMARALNGTRACSTRSAEEALDRLLRKLEAINNLSKGVLGVKKAEPINPPEGAVQPGVSYWLSVSNFASGATP